MLSTIDERGSKIDRNSLFGSHLSPVWRQMAIINTVSIDFLSTFLDSIGIFDCRLHGVRISEAICMWSVLCDTKCKPAPSHWCLYIVHTGH